MKILSIKPSYNLNYGYADRATVSQTGDSGLDLFVQADTICAPRKVTMLHHDIMCEMLDSDYDQFTKTYRQRNVAYFLIPRSSISKTPLMMANSVGLVDAEYRGEIMGAVFNTSNEEYVVKAGTRLFQIAAPNLEPFMVTIVEELSPSTRGTNGFGSTGV